MTASASPTLLGAVLTLWSLRSGVRVGPFPKLHLHLGSLRRCVASVAPGRRRLCQQRELGAPAHLPVRPAGSHLLAVRGQRRQYDDAHIGAGPYPRTRHTEQLHPVVGVPRQMDQSETMGVPCFVGRDATSRCRPIGEQPQGRVSVPSR
jgi:hypothetical protein